MPLDPVPGGHDADVVLVGGGLANGLIAWRLLQCKPHLRIMLLEAGATLGGNHTWSFHESDLDAAQHAWLAPLVVHRWPHYSVKFPGRVRQLDSGYASITAEHFDAVLSRDLGTRVQRSARARALTPHSVTLADGRTLRAKVVIDGRGVTSSPHVSLGFQKFLGQELQLAAPHNLTGPILMDACVEQQDGYRFVYTLPLAPDRVLIEDTFYADSQRFDVSQLRSNIAAYAHARGWQVARVVREEQGVLPITLAGDITAFWQAAGGVPRAGLAAGLFNPATGYSLPDAVRLADRLAALPDAAWQAETIFDVVRTHAFEQWQSQGFFRLLNRMLFKAAAPAQRRRVIERFYGFSLPLIKRFYAGQLRPLDKARILSGRPPVALGAAWRAAFSRYPAALPQEDVS